MPRYTIGHGVWGGLQPPLSLGPTLVRYTTCTTIHSGRWLPRPPPQPMPAVPRSTPGLPHRPSVPRASPQGCPTHLGFGLDSSTGPSGEERSTQPQGQKASDLVPALPLISWAPTRLCFSICTVSSFQPRGSLVLGESRRIKAVGSQTPLSLPPSGSLGTSQGTAGSRQEEHPPRVKLQRLLSFTSSRQGSFASQ